jgi:hypothetical protein
MNAESTAAPDERALGEAFQGPLFLAGVDAGRWRLLELAWPHALIAVSAAPRPGAPDQFVLRFELSGYPQEAPTAAPWNHEKEDLLGADERPKGGRAGEAFNLGWHGGSALYIPCDREALREHPDWRRKYPRWAWDPAVGITLYLRLAHELLNDEDYLGV